jgi:antitoxin (DNA-binding transcriptional repressor) of toxin-antitoxin stability system
MKTVNIHEAKTHLSRLVQKASEGEAFAIARAGRPLVKVMALDSPGPGNLRRLGFLAGQFEVPEDFDRMGEDQLQGLFGGRE